MDVTRRYTFQEKVEGYTQEGFALVYIDESGFCEAMPRTHSYSHKGTRAYGSYDWNNRKRTNVIGALCDHKLITVGLTQSNINADIVYAWLCKDLLTKLPQRSVIIMDNATFHKRKDIQEAIQKAGHILEYLPPYSPDLNPIEQLWAKAKQMVRSFEYSIDELFNILIK